jgi:predicted amidohydrolase
VQGEPHARVFEIKGAKIGVIICIETTHDPWSYLPENSGVEAILWPGFYAVTAPRTWSDEQSADTRKIRENLEHWRVPLLQVTCASSPEAEYWPDQQFGGSVVLDERGREAFSLAPGREELGIVEVEHGKILAARSLRESAWKSRQPLL